MVADIGVWEYRPFPLPHVGPAIDQLEPPPLSAAAAIKVHEQVGQRTVTPHYALWAPYTQPDSALSDQLAPAPDRSISLRCKP